MKNIYRSLQMVTFAFLPVMLLFSSETFANNCDARVIFDNQTTRDGALYMTSSNGSPTELQIFVGRKAKVSRIWKGPRNCKENTLLAAQFITGMGEGYHHCRPITGQSLLNTDIHVTLGPDHDHPGYDACTIA